MRLSPLLLFPLLALPACSGPSAAGPDGNVVFLASPTCRTFVVKTFEGGFGVLETRDAGYAARAADLLEGDLRPGDGTLQYVPDRALRQGEDARGVDVRVVARNVSVGDAQERYRAACPLAALPGVDAEELPDEVDDDDGDA